MFRRADRVREFCGRYGDEGLLGWIARQGTVEGLDLVDFNFPQHLEGWEVDTVSQVDLQYLEGSEVDTVS